MPREDGYKNLVPMDQRSQEEARSYGAQGGRASGAARRRKRSMREAADYYCALPVTDTRLFNRLSKDGINPEDIDNQMAMIAGLTKAAILGNAKAAKVIIDLLGDTPTDDAAGHENNLLEAIKEAGEVNTDDLPEAE